MAIRKYHIYYLWAPLSQRVRSQIRTTHRVSYYFVFCSVLLRIVQIYTDNNNLSLFGLLLAQPGRLHLIEFTENDIKLRGIRSSKRQLKHIIYLMNFQIGFLKNMDQFVSASQCSPHRNRYSMHSNNCFFLSFSFR